MIRCAFSKKGVKQTAVMDPSQIPLRDIHLPPAIGWWPPAPGWWLLPALGVMIIGGLLWLRRRLTRPNVRKAALQELQRLQDDHSLPTAKGVGELSILLRRISLSAYPHRESAGLVGVAWLRFLDQPLGNKGFSLGPGSVLIDAPYRRDADVDFDALCALCREWIMALPKRPS